MARSSTAEKLVLALAQGIADGRWPPGRPLPSVRELAREMDISPPTAMKMVRLAAERGLATLRRSQPAMVPPNAREAAAALLSRRLPVAYPSLKTDSDLTHIALLFPEMDWPLVHPTQVSLRQHLDMLAPRNGFQFDLMPWSLKDQIPFALSLPARGYAGAVCLGLQGVYQAGLIAMRNQRFPAIIINRRMPHVGVPTICGNDYKPIRELAVRLARMGHRNMAMISDVLPPIGRDVHGAVRGWVDGLAEAGVYPQCSIAVNMVPDYQRIRNNPRIFEQILLRPDRPTALFFYWPTWANILLADPRFAAFRVPDDLSLVIAIPGERPISLPNAPPITTLDFDYPRMALCIIQTMADLIAGRPRPELLMMPLVLHLTESIGPPPKS